VRELEVDDTSRSNRPLKIMARGHQISRQVKVAGLVNAVCIHLNVLHEHATCMHKVSLHNIFEIVKFSGDKEKYKDQKRPAVIGVSRCWKIIVKEIFKIVQLLQLHRSHVSNSGILSTVA
jgi:hypothetical protein